MTTLRLVHVLPTVLDTYGDRGNVTVLVRRARARGIIVDTVAAGPGRPVPPDASLYVIGGGEDHAQATAATLLRRDGGLRAGVAGGGVIFAVCAGLQLLGHTFRSGSSDADGLGLLDVATVPSVPRAVGEIVVDGGHVGQLTGFENHAGRTVRGPGIEPLGRVAVGVGNGDGTDGVVHGRIIATYMHGPVLARNPELADHLLAVATGTELEPFDDPQADALHDERLRAARRSPRPRRPRWFSPRPTST